MKTLENASSIPSPQNGAPEYSRSGADLSLTALRECAAIAGACGYPLSEAFLAAKNSQLTAPASSLTSSMYRDLKDQAPVEVDSILGDPIEWGRKHGVSGRIVQAAFVSLTIYQQRRARAKAARNASAS